MPVPPLAPLLLNGAGVAPAQMSWSAAMLPAVSAGTTVRVMEGENSGPQGPELTRRRKKVVVVSGPGANVSPVAPAMVVQVLLSGDDSHWYANVPVPPVAGVALVSGAGVAPGHTFWLAAMVPAVSAGVTVMVTTLEKTGTQAVPELARRRKKVVAVSGPGAKVSPVALPMSLQVVLSGEDCHW